MSPWISFTIFYAILISFFEIFKKKASEKTSIVVILYFLSLISLVLSFFISPDFYKVDINDLLNIAIKSLFVVFSWAFSLYALSKLPVGLYAIIKTSRIIFTVILSIIILGEFLSIKTFVGIGIVIIGIIIANMISKSADNKAISYFPILVLIIGSVFTSFSEILDKTLMSSLSVGQMQFWFLFFNTLYLRFFLLIKRNKIDYKIIITNYWIILASLFLVIGDRFLFYANSIQNSQVSIMTILKQISIILLIILGRVIFNEKDTLKKLLCSLLIILGIIIIFI